MTQTVATNGRAVAQYEVSDIERMARAISASKLFGMATPEQAIALCLIAQAEGRHPASAAQDYHIIQGKPSKKADAMLRDFINAGGKVEWHKLDDDIADATFSHPGGGSVRITWDHARAKQAGIANPMWRKYPRQMLRSRVVSEGVRTVYPLATSGMYVPEEVVEFVPRDVADATVIEHDAPKKRVRDGSDGTPKSSRQAKLAGDWEITREIAALKTDAELDAWQEKHAATIATFNTTWREQYDELIDAKRETLGSATTRKELLKLLHGCADATAIQDWQDACRDAFRSMSKADQQEVVRERDARLAELFQPEPDEVADADGVLEKVPF